MPKTFRDLAARQHGPSPSPGVACPECGAPLTVEEHEEFTPSRAEARTPARLAVCGGCGFLHRF